MVTKIIACDRTSMAASPIKETNVTVLICKTAEAEFNKASQELSRVQDQMETLGKIYPPASTIMRTARKRANDLAKIVKSHTETALHLHYGH